MQETQINIPEKTFRECGMLVTVAAQGTGKSHQNKILICKYVKDKIHTKVKGRKCLIFDTNGEYGTESFGINGIPPLEVKRIAVKDVEDWCRSDIVECRRIDMKSLSADEKLKILGYLLPKMRSSLVIIEDVNTVCLDVNHMKNIVSSLVNLRHRAVDVIISYQSLRAVEPRIFSNCKYVRLHHTIGDVDDVKGKLSEPDVFKIAQLLINKKFYDGNERFFLYLHTNPHKLQGAFTRAEFLEACGKFLQLNKRKLRDEQEITGCSMEVAIKNISEQLYGQFYGNKDKIKK